jgi:hypothetical protein
MKYLVVHLHLSPSKLGNYFKIFAREDIFKLIGYNTGCRKPLLSVPPEG